MATTQSSTPSLFNFLKEGLLLPTRNRRLFATVFALIVASSSLLLLGTNLAVKPLVDEIRVDTNKALNGTDPRSPEFHHLVQEIHDEARKLLITIAVCLLVSLIVGHLVRVVVLFAAVATYSGELHTFASLLGKARTQLKGPLLTLAFVYVLEIACIALVSAMVGIHRFLVVTKQYLALVFISALLAVVASVFFVLFSFVCSLSLVVAVAEPGCCGAGAVGRAWRLMKGKLLRAVLFILVTLLLAAAIWPVYSLAKKCAVTSMASGLLLGFLYTILTAAVGLFGTCALTAFYYECKGSTEASAMEYIMLSTKELINV